jgi:tetratricopeptide (TPR) repeat protein
MATLSDILDEDLLLDLAGDRYFERGVDYFEQGLVHSLVQYDEHIIAKVYGTKMYEVHLWLEDNTLMSRCNCPLGVDELFCKHCVAVGLAWIAEPPPYHPAEDMPTTAGTPMAGTPMAGTTIKDVRDYLSRQDHDTLVQLILDQAMEDSRWREQLLMKAASHRPGGADIGTFRKALRDAIATGGFIDYYAADAYADDVQSAVSGLADLLDQGYASDVIDLSEEAIGLLEDAFNSVDDSSGHLGIIMDQLQNLHYQACEIAQPNPQALAERLFHIEMNSGFGFFDNALETYADILGDDGRETYRHLVDADWEKLPAIGADARHQFDYRRSKLNRMKETLVAATGNLEDLVAVISRDLSQPARYLKIAQLYQDAGQLDTAIAWAERGLNAFQDSYFTGQLGDFLIAIYEQQTRFDDAVAIVWDDFSRSPSLPQYKKLKQQAEKAHDWTTWRDRALAHIRQSTQPTSPQSYNRLRQIGFSLLVEIFLWEGDVDQAWKEAQTGGCSKNLWMRLADERAAEHPEDALSVYQPAIEPLINQTDNQAYHQAVDLVLKVRDLMSRLDRKAEFDRFLANLTTTYKRKRNFIKFLKQKGY